MFRNARFLPSLALFLLAACGGEDHEHAAGDDDHGNGHEHGEQYFAVWPEDGATVFATTPLSIGSMSEAGHVHGTVGVQVGGDAPQPGNAMPDGILSLEPGAESGMITLPGDGEHTLHVCLYDESGKATDHCETVTWTVEAIPEEFGAEFVGLRDGAKVKSPLQLTFALEGAAVSPAGQNLTDKTVGHHHLIIDGAATPIGMVVPNDEQHLHYGGGQTSAEIELSPGAHTLTMQLADGLHRSYGPMLSARVRIVVE